ncbi:3-oxoadipate enol-lactonase [Duganella sp. FT80W]|uniref:3-oxoadipate enol-lactonase n=1 Tax=Duganella guangzhouensis TaxID=2666084 RepID=A0A6I2KVG4_9BURK|nr:3-oxoadipate enol-lactonase [Duganella guangzhouensis]MRW89803.1 3-oxoadipate enol-lactonase [Duganella guangzhouensis]
MPFMDTAGAQLHYRTDGSSANPCVVLSNSLGTDLSMWDAQAAALALDHYVIRYDVRGHGLSSPSSTPLDLARLGLDVIALLDHLAIERAAFCGISMGGLTGQWLGIHAPQRFTRLILANTAARIGTADGWLARAQQVRTEGMSSVAAGASARWFTPAFIARDPVTVARMTGRLREQDANGYADCCLVLAAANLREDVGRINLPTLIIAGDADPVTTVADGIWLREQIPNAQLATVPASHISNIEANMKFTTQLRAFL